MIQKKDFTIKDVASTAGVSTATVSRYLNGKYDQMSNETRCRIEQIIADMEYNPNNLARGLRSSRSKTIAIMVADILNPYYIEILKGIEEESSKRGYNVIVCNVGEDLVKERDCIFMLESKQIDGLIVTCINNNADLLYRITKSLPVVLIDVMIPELPCDAVITNYSKGTSLAVSHLIEQGCKEIHMVMPSKELMAREWKSSYFKEKNENIGNDSIKTELIYVESYSEIIIGKIIEKLLAEKTLDKKGLILGNSILSLLALKACKYMDVNVYNQLLVIGFDDPDWASVTTPSLTVISQQTYEIGRSAVDLLISSFDANTRQENRTIYFDVELIPRESTIGIRSVT